MIITVTEKGRELINSQSIEGLNILTIIHGQFRLLDYNEGKQLIDFNNITSNVVLENILISFTDQEDFIIELISVIFYNGDDITNGHFNISLLEMKNKTGKVFNKLISDMFFNELF